MRDVQKEFDRSKTPDTMEVYAHCSMCKTRFTLHLTKKEYNDFKIGNGNIQDILPRLSRDERELLISNTCPMCFNEIFKEDDDE